LPLGQIIPALSSSVVKVSILVNELPSMATLYKRKGSKHKAKSAIV
jgi:hypothetical protein